MNKRELSILEKAFSAENNAGSRNGMHLIQTRAKLAEKLVDDGYLAHRTVVLGVLYPVTIKGYELTHAGRLTYCASCDIDPEGAPTP